MMKRKFAALLCVALLSMATTAFAADTSAPEAAAPQETTAAKEGSGSDVKLGTVPHSDFGVAEEYKDHSFPENAERLIWVGSVDGSEGGWVLIPEGEKAEDYYGKAVWYTFGEQLGTYDWAGDNEDGNEEPFNGYNTREAYTPTVLTVIGPELYGEVTELAEDRIVIAAYYGAEPESEGDAFAVTLNAETQMMGKIVEGDTCAVIYDPQTRVALVCMEAHG